MGKQDECRILLAPYLAQDGSLPELERVLVAGSNLPGPRGNLELAWAFADAVAVRRPAPALIAALRGWAAITAQQAPTNDPREFLPFCALLGLGALYLGLDRAGRAETESTLRRAASDGRWRLREGVAMGLQRIAEWDFGALQKLVTAWLPEATLLEQRAILAALAHPPVLVEPARAAFCLDVADRVLAGLAGLDRAARQTEGFAVLAKGLSYALSVFVAPAPGAGFAFLGRWAAVEDAHVRRIVRANLGKARLAKRYPAAVAGVLAVLDGTPGS